MCGKKGSNKWESGMGKNIVGYLKLEEKITGNISHEVGGCFEY